MLGGGAGSVQDMINRFRDNRALLGRRKLRFKAGRRYFDEKPLIVSKKTGLAAPRQASSKHLDEIRLRMRKDARFNQALTIIIILISAAMIAFFVYRVLTYY